MDDVATRKKATQVIAIDGCSGAGKSSLADALGRELRLEPTQIIRLDDLYPGWDGLEAGVDRLVTEILAPISRGEPAQVRPHQWVPSAHRVRAPIDVPSASLLVVEGCGAGARRCAAYVSMLVWVDAPEDVRYRRAMSRDGQLYRPHWQRWADQEAAHYATERTASRADLIIDGRTWAASSQ